MAVKARDRDWGGVEVEVEVEAVGRRKQGGGVYFYEFREKV